MNEINTFIVAFSPQEQLLSTCLRFQVPFSGAVSADLREEPYYIQASVFLPSLFLFQSFAYQGLKVSYLHHNWNVAAALPDIHPSTGMSSNSRMDLLTGCFVGDFDCPCSWTCSVLTAHIPPMSLHHHVSLNWAPFYVRICCPVPFATQAQCMVVWDDITASKLHRT